MAVLLIAGSCSSVTSTDEPITPGNAAASIGDVPTASSTAAVPTAEVRSPSEPQSTPETPPPAAVAEPASTPAAASSEPESDSATIEVNGVAVGSLEDAVQDARRGDVITIGPGEARIFGALRIEADITIAGSGVGVTTVRATDHSNVFALFRDGITIRDLSLSTDYEAPTDEERFNLIEADGVHRFLLTDLALTGAQQNGFGTFGEARGVVANVMVSNSWAAGISIGDQSVVDVHGVESRDNDGSGFWWYGTSSGLATGNTSTGNGHDGYSINDTAQPRLRANQAMDNEGDGFSWYDKSAGVAIGNSSTSAAFSGYTTFDSASPTLIANTAAENDEFGFSTLGQSAPTVIANHADSNALSGFSATGESAATFTANRATENGDAGFVWFDQSGGNAVANIATFNDLEGFIATDDSTPTWGGNFGLRPRGGDLFFSDSTAGEPPAGPGTETVRYVDAAQTEGLSLADTIASANEGDVILLSAGDHSLPQATQLNTRLVLIGQGTEETRIIVGTGSVGLELSANGSVVQGFTIRRANSAVAGGSDGLVTVTGANATIDNVAAVGNTGHGVAVVGQGTAVLTNVTTNFNALAGIYAFDDAVVEAHGASMEGNGHFGMAYAGASAGTISTSISTRNGRSGLSFAASANADVIANASISNEQAGYIWYADTEGRAVANEASLNNDTGFSAVDQSSPTWAGNNATSNRGDAFFVGPDSLATIDE